MTFNEFKEMVKNSCKGRPGIWWMALKPGRIVYDPMTFEPKKAWLPNIFMLLFRLHFVLPISNTNGEKKTWYNLNYCWPWQWYRKYYEYRMDKLNNA